MSCLKHMLAPDYTHWIKFSSGRLHFTVFCFGKTPRAAKLKGKSVVLESLSRDGGSWNLWLQKKKITELKFNWLSVSDKGEFWCGQSIQIHHFQNHIRQCEPGYIDVGLYRPTAYWLHLTKFTELSSTVTHQLLVEKYSIKCSQLCERL